MNHEDLSHFKIEVPWIKNPEYSGQTRCLFGDMCQLEIYKKISVNNHYFDLLHCKEHQIYFVSEQPDNRTLQEMYSQEYYSGEMGDYLGIDDRTDHQRRAQDAVVRLDEIEKFIKCGEMIETGCGLGHVVKEAIHRGWKAIGLEISPYAVREMHRNNIPAVAGELEHLPFQGEVCDVVAFYNVLEHTRNPRLALLEADRVLKKGGFAVFRIPETPPNGPSMHLIDHLWHFNFQSISTLLSEVGLEMRDYQESGILWSKKLNDSIKSVTIISQKMRG